MIRLTQAKWLEHFRFRFFPFDKLEAANDHLRDPAILARSFIEPDNFDKVFGFASSSATSMLFADRGTGKTACRVMIDYYCSNGVAPISLDANGNMQFGYILSVPHVHMIEVVERYKNSEKYAVGTKPDIDFHIQEILRRSVLAFWNLLHKEIVFRRKVQNLSQNSVLELSRIILKYPDYLASEQHSFLEELGLYPSIMVKGGNLLPDETPAWFSSWKESKERLSHIANLAEWADLMFQLGVACTYLLVDGLDELDETAEDPYAAFDYIRPLLTNMRLIDGIPHLAVKFFLPSSVQPVVMANSGLVRLDRIPVTETIVWDSNKLLKILRGRIATARDDRAAEEGFNGLCVRGSEIETDLIKACEGNPRYLMNLCASMVEAHIKTEQPDDLDDPFLLTREDFQKARDQLELRTRRLIHIADPSEYSYPYLHKLIQGGESETVEFKQRVIIGSQELNGDPEVDKVRDRINLTKLSVVKAIAGMMNTKGGTLLIGVEDDGRVFGIEKDFQAINDKRDPDGYNQRLSRLVEEFLGLVNIRFIKTRFVVMDGHMICLMNIEKASWPVFLKNKYEKKDKDGNIIEQIEFYIRGPAVTRKLNPDETQKYVDDHWKKE